MAARQDGNMILVPEPGRSATRAASAQRRIPWTYGELATVLADMRKLSNIKHGDRVLIVGASGAPLLATAWTDAWSVAVTPRLLAPEVERLGRHGTARRIFLDDVPDTAHRYADIFVVPGPGARTSCHSHAGQRRRGTSWLCRTPPGRHRRPAWNNEMPL